MLSASGLAHLWPEASTLLDPARSPDAPHLPAQGDLPRRAQSGGTLAAAAESVPAVGTGEPGAAQRPSQDKGSSATTHGDGTERGGRLGPRGVTRDTAPLHLPWRGSASGTRTGGGAGDPALSGSSSGQEQSLPIPDTSEVRAARGHAGSTSSRALAGTGSGEGQLGAHVLHSLLITSRSETPRKELTIKQLRTPPSPAGGTQKLSTFQGRCTQPPSQGPPPPHPTQNQLPGRPPMQAPPGAQTRQRGGPWAQPGSPATGLLPLWVTTPGRGHGVSEDTSFRPSPFICSVCSWR